MSTSFPNSNGSLPPYNSQANGSFNQYPQTGPPPGGYPPMEQFHPNMYAPNGYGGMPPGQPNMGGPSQAAPPSSQKLPPPQQYAGGGPGVKLPAYDGNTMQNGYMGYPPQHQRPPGPPPPQNGPPPNYNAHTQMPPPPNNIYGGVTDPYRMYPGMPGPQAQSSNQQNPSSLQRPPSQNNGVSSQPPPNQSNSLQYPTQQPLPAHLHGGPPYQGMPPPGNAPLQHYQPPNYGNNGTAAPRPPQNQTFPPLQPSKQAKQEESRPNSMSGASNPHSQFPNYGGVGTPTSYDSFNAGPGGYPGYGQPPGSHGQPGSSGAQGMNGGSTTPGGQGSFGYNPGLYGAPGSNTGGHNTPGQSTPGQNTPGNPSSGHHTPGQHTPSQLTPGHQTPGHSTPGHSTPTATSGPSGNPFGSMGNQTPGQYNDPMSSQGPSGSYGAMHSSGNSTPTNHTEHSTPNHVAPTTPGTPGSLGPMGSASNQAPLSHQKTPQQQNHMPPPQYNPNNMMSPSHNSSGNTPQKHPNSSPMGSSLPPLNGQYPPMAYNMQSPVNSTNSEPTFKEPAIPIRHSPSHLQSPVHPPPTGAPPAYNAPSNSTRTPEATTSAQPARSHSPTFAVPTLPAAATLAQASSANQVSTKPKTSPQKKRGDEGVPEPPTQDTPFTLVTHYELPAAMTGLRDTLSVGPNEKVNAQVEKQYFSRKRQQLRVPYPEGTKAQTAKVVEPDTFGFMQGTKYFNEKYNRMIPSQSSMGPPLLSRSQSMHTTMVSPAFNATQASTSGRQPAKKARSASDASEPAFNTPLPPSKQPRVTDPRQMQQIHMQQYHHQMQMKMQQQQMAAHQQHMARMGHPGSIPSTSSASGISPAPGQPPLPSLAPPSLQRAESMPQLPSQQQPPMGGGPMPPHMGGLPPMNGSEGPTDNNNSGHHNNHQIGLSPRTLGNQGQDGTLNHDYFSNPSTSNQAQVHCAGCHHFVSPGSPTLCCMYQECKNVYHQECTRLTSNALNYFNGTPKARWVCPNCEGQVRPMPMQHA